MGVERCGNRTRGRCENRGNARGMLSGQGDAVGTV